MKKLLICICGLLLIAFVSFQASARMNVGMVGGGVPAVGGVTYDEGNLLSERWGAQGTWSETVEGTTTITYNDTTYTDTGFDGSQLKVTTGSSSQAYITKALGSAASAVYFRFYYICAAESFADGNNEYIFVLAGTGQNMGDQTYLFLRLTQVSGQFRLQCSIAGESAWGSGIDTYNISTGTVYKIEGKVVDDGADGSAEWKVNGVSIATKTGLAAFGTVAIQNIHVGITYGGQAVQHFDTLDIDSSGYLVDE